MNTKELLDKVLATKLRHLLTMERNMLALLPRIKKGNQEAQKKYEWYLQAAKQTGIKELAALDKLLAPTEEVNDDFDGFDDG
jgi:hypothetical protein